MIRPLIRGLGVRLCQGKAPVHARWNGMEDSLFGGGNGEGQTDEILEFDPSSSRGDHSHLAEYQKSTQCGGLGR